MALEYGSRALAEIVRQAEDGEVLLPNFQRGFVWNQDAQAAIASSVLLQIPAGSLLLIRGEQTDYECRGIGSTKRYDNVSESASCEFLLDGQQRLTTLRQVFSDPFAKDWQDVHRATYNSLRVRWSLQLVPEDSDDDLFGHGPLKFTGLAVEPDLIRDALNRHPIWLTKGQDKWYHPSFKKEAASRARALAIGQAAADEGAVPLWEVVGGDVATAEVAVKRISRGQFDRLKAELEDGTLDEQMRQELADESGFGQLATSEQLIEQLRDRRAEWETAVMTVIRGVREYRLSTIVLTKDELSKAIVIFEAINRGGSPLTPFDLIAARFAKAGSKNEALPALISAQLDGFTQDIPASLETTTDQWVALRGVMRVDDELTTIFKTHFLQVLSSLKHGAPTTVEHLKQTTFLQLSPDEIRMNWAAATDAVAAAWRFLQIRCGVPKEGALRNKLVVLPIAVSLKSVENPDAAVYAKIEYWYWCSVLTSNYTQRQNERSVEDINQLRRWVTGEIANPFRSLKERVLADPQYSDVDTLLRSGDDTISSDVGLYLLQLVTSLGGQDPIRGKRIKVWIDDIEDHHLIPLGSVATVGESTKAIRRGEKEEHRILNSPLNRAYILKESNRAIAAKSLSQYMSGVPKSVKASLFFTGDTSFVPTEGRSSTEHARAVLASRFHSIRTAVVNHLSRLEQKTEA